MAKITFIKPSAIKDGSIELAKLSAEAQAAFAAANHNHDLKDLDEDGIIDGLDGRISVLDKAINGDNTASDANAKAGLANRLATVEGLLTGGEGSVAEQIQDAVDAAKSDILGKNGDADFVGTVKSAYEAAADAQSAADDAQADATAALDAIGDKTKGLTKDIADLSALHGEKDGAKMTVAAEAESVASAVIANWVKDTPAAFDTLQEIAAWIGSGDVENTTAATMLTDIATLKTTVGAASTDSSEASGLFKRIETLEAADASAVTAEKIAAWNAVADAKDGYDDHIADADIHVTKIQKDAWDAKQEALSAEDLARIAAVDDKAEASTVAALDKYIKGDADASTDAAKKGLEGRIADLETAAVNDAVTVSATDGVTKGGVTYKYVHNTQDAKEAAFVKVGNDAEGHVVLGDAVAKSDITGLLDAGDGTYDAKGAADGVKSDVIGNSGDASTADTIYGAKAYADSLAGNYLPKVDEALRIDVENNKIAVKVGTKWYDLAHLLGRILDITDLEDGSAVDSCGLDHAGDIWTGADA